MVGGKDVGFMILLLCRNGREEGGPRGLTPLFSEAMERPKVEEGAEKVLYQTKSVPQWLKRVLKRCGVRLE
jgi:hypothetical protein